MPEPTLQSPAIGLHTEFIKQRIPQWFKDAALHRQLAFKQLEPTLPQWLHDATAQAWHTLKHNHQQHRQALNHTDRLLNRLQGLDLFAEPLLKQAIKTTFGLELDVRNTYLAHKLARPTRSDLGGALVLDTTHNNLIPNYREISLLEAALANFTASETSPGPCTDCVAIVPYRDSINPLEIALPIRPEAFARLCRTLDLGQRYQEHLKAILEPEEVSKRRQVRESLIASDQKALALCANIALFKGDIQADTQVLVQEVIANRPNVLWHGKPVRYSRLKILSSVLSGILLISGDRSGTTTERVLIYIPGDDTRPLKEYASYRACIDDLLHRLKSARFRQFFARFVGLNQQGAFFSRLKHSFDPHDRLSHTDDYTGTAKGLEFADEFIGDLWLNRCDVHLRKLFSDAQTAAVPTNTEDARERLSRLEGFFNAAIDTFNVAAFFIPGVGQIMLLVGCAQMLNDAFTGIEAWEQGEIDQAWGHLASVALNVGFIATASQVLPAIQNSSLVDGLQPVTLPGSETRLWKPDLNPYEFDPVPAALQPNDRGLHLYNGAEWLSVEGKTYHVEQGPRSPGYRIKHPDRPQAYAPRVQHNGQGAWLIETEQPLQWSDSQLFKRLSPVNASFSDEEAARILAITQTEPGVLRRIHADGLPTPALLADTVQRFKIDRDIEHFITQMQSSDPAERQKADPQSQLQLLTSDELWPKSKVLRVIGHEGEIIAQYPKAGGHLPRIQILESQLKNGDLLSTVLQTLDDTETRLLLGESPAPGDTLSNHAVRTARLYSTLVRMAQAKRVEMFDSHYNAAHMSANPQVSLLQDTFPGLTVRSAQELIWHADLEELQQLLDHNTLAPRLQEEARWHVLQTRANRAYEGLFLDSVASADSEWLALKTIEAMPGWSADIRLEVREEHFSGKLLNSIGSQDAPIRKVLIKSQNLYSARDADNLQLHGPDDLYSAVLHAVPDRERKALDLPHVGQGQNLKQSVRQRPLLPRLPVQLYLDSPPVAINFESPMRLARGRESYPLLGGDTPGQPLPSLGQLAQRLFPGFNPIEKTRFLATLPADPVLARQRLAQLRTEYLELSDELEIWALNSPTNHPITGEPNSQHMLQMQLRSRREFGELLKRCWRRQTGSDHFYTFQPGYNHELISSRVLFDSMPALNADFSHVSRLSLRGLGPITGLEEFLQQFPNLRRLRLQGIQMDRLPEVLAAMPGLFELKLPDCGITLTPESALVLGGMEQLEIIELDNNPLGITPDFSNMPDLLSVSMQNCNLTEFPVSILSRPRLQTADFTHNEIVTLPDDIFEAPVAQTHLIFISGTALSEQSLQRVRTYYLQTGIDLGINMLDLEPLPETTPEE